MGEQVVTRTAHPTTQVTAETVAHQHRPRIPIEQIIVYALLTVAAIMAILPLMWAFAASFTPSEKVFANAYPFSWRALLPLDFTVSAYNNIFARGFGTAIGNTLILSISTVFVGGIIATMAGFAFARFSFRGKNLLFGLVLLTFMIPVDLTAIPRYIMVNRLEWVNTWQGLLIPSLVNSLVIFLCRQFFEDIPQELIDAARVDGASWLRLFFGIVLPISTPLLISAALLLFLGQWDAFFWPLLIAPAPQMTVIQVAITSAVTEHRTVWNELLAGSMMAAIIPILLALPFQRYYVQAITNSGLKD